MKKTTNIYQENYMKAKALLETLEATEAEAEREYMKANGITNPDGSTPKRIYCIYDEATFNKANEETAQANEKSGLWQEILEARDLLKEAETALIEYGLKIVPAGIAKTLRESAAKNYTTRQKIIGLVLQLDTSTVPTQSTRAR